MRITCFDAVAWVDPATDRRRILDIREVIDASILDAIRSGARFERSDSVALSLDRARTLRD
ncbi:hypothetical protein [Methylobacterium sp. Leaf456]|uniref:hypothetical protein n=1 Tax=Methylobacterium sp. Leaf456 TaxID=1736382 RepID=UPI0012E3BB42|nr:hypothetical protein [Methylobacterium sp. Leaf456]